ncbi:MAG: TonB family protein [Acidobacteriia bacterium]|nr:TonB family protein [Terriglobia bacterium]
MRVAYVILVLVFLLLPAVSNAGEKRIVPAEEAVGHVLKWVKPDYPSVARVAHLQGDVVLQVSISKTGDVSNVRVKSGHPFLVQPAVDAIQGWLFRPFEVEGKAAAVEALIKIQFPPGDSPEEIKEAPEKLAEFSSVISACQEKLRDEKPVEAEPICRKAIALASELAPHRQLERVDAFQQTGHAFFLQKKFAEALENYQQELQYASQAVEHGVEIAAAHRHVANALWGTGRKEEARVEYEQAEIIYAEAEANANSPFLQNGYAKNRKAVMLDHAALLRQMGQNEEAEFLEKQAAAIVIKETVRE